PDDPRRAGALTLPADAAIVVRDCSMEVRFTSFTRESVEHYCVLALSILKHNRQHGVGFHLLTTPEIAQEFTTIQRLRLCIETHGGALHVTTREMISFVPEQNPRLKFFFKARHFDDVPNAFYENKKPFLLLDDDMVCRRSIKELFEIDLPEGYIAGATDCGTKEPDYLNAGTILARPFTATLKETFAAYFKGKNNPALLGGKDPNFQVDQGAINIFFSGKKIILPQKYNMIATSEETTSIFEKPEEPVFVHFIGEKKPWNGEVESGYELYFTEWSEYYAELNPTPIHAAWAANNTKQLGYAITSYYSMQHYCPRKIIPHFLITFSPSKLDERCAKFKEHIIEIDTNIFEGWNPRTWTYAIFCKNIAPYFVEIPKEHKQRLLISDNDIIYRCDVSSLHDTDLHGFSYAAFETPFEKLKNIPCLQWHIRERIRSHSGEFICADVKKIKSLVSLKTLSENAVKCAERLDFYMPDEDLWAVTYGNNFLALDYSWRGVDPWNENKASHFICGRKPWNYDIRATDGTPLKKFSETVRTVSMNDLSKYYIEWIRFYEMFERGEEPKYSGRAKENNVHVSFFGLTPPKLGIKHVASKDFFFGRTFVKKGEVFYPQLSRQLELIRKELSAT
ncbi:MAG: hypothetical protein LBT00_04730, partial [Spirochaetaceae bacterium]|nr:hypothetical protein [Spirochaetaceae bacterium]